MRISSRSLSELSETAEILKSMFPSGTTDVESLGRAFREGIQCVLRRHIVPSYEQFCGLEVMHGEPRPEFEDYSEYLNRLQGIPSWKIKAVAKYIFQPSTLINIYRAFPESLNLGTQPIETQEDLNQRMAALGGIDSFVNLIIETIREKVRILSTPSAQTT